LTRPSPAVSRRPETQEGVVVKKASEYRKHAEECRALAKGVVGEQRDQLLEMAATWERLATERSELIQRHPDLALTGEHAEETATGKPSSTS
jgi:hypothetical protein